MLDDSSNGRSSATNHDVCFSTSSAFSQTVPVTVIKKFHYEGREDEAVCPPAWPSDDCPHGNTGLISLGWILEGCALCVCTEYVSVCCVPEVSTSDDSTIGAERMNDMPAAPDEQNANWLK